jgi:predicted HicB family RNase H-like nuclease
MSQSENDVRRITLRIPPKLHHAITLAARDRAISLNHLAVKALEQYLIQ